MTADPERWLRRLERDTLLIGGLMAAAALALWPDRPARAAGVIGGLLLIAVSYKGIVAGVAGLWAPTSTGGVSPNLPDPRELAVDPGAGSAAGRRGPPPSRGFVKFFTRHAILAVGAYVMIARFEFDPMAMLAGVTAPAVAATVEVVRTVRARRSGPQSR